MATHTCNSSVIVRTSRRHAGCSAVQGQLELRETRMPRTWGKLFVSLALSLALATVAAACMTPAADEVTSSADLAMAAACPVDDTGTLDGAESTSLQASTAGGADAGTILDDPYKYCPTGDFKEPGNDCQDQSCKYCSNAKKGGLACSVVGTSNPGADYGHAIVQITVGKKKCLLDCLNRTFLSCIPTKGRFGVCALCSHYSPKGKPEWSVTDPADDTVYYNVPCRPNLVATTTLVPVACRR